MQKRILILIPVIIVAILVFGFFKKTQTDNLSKSVEPTPSNESLPISATITTPSGAEISVRVADDPKERELGLSYFPVLPENQGMLFLFEKTGNYPFWMKGMNFPLDIIWLKKISETSFQVVYVAKNVKPSTYPNFIDPKTEADAVLEVASGQTIVLDIVEGVVLRKTD